MAKTTTIRATSRISTKIKDTFYTFEYCEERQIEEGDDVEIDFDTGIIKNNTKNEEYKGQPFPEFMQKIIDSEGLINYINAK